MIADEVRLLALLGNRDRRARNERGGQSDGGEPSCQRGKRTTPSATDSLSKSHSAMARI